MSKLRKHYKNRLIEATTAPLPRGSFNVQVNIENHTASGHVDVTEFYSGQTFETEVAALEAGIKLGQQKVDGVRGSHKT